MRYQMMVLGVLCHGICACGAAVSSPEVTPGVNASASGRNVEETTEEAAPFEVPEVHIDEVEADLQRRYLEAGIASSIARKLAAAHLELMVPESLEMSVAPDNEVWEWDFQVHSGSGKVEVRFKIIPEAQDAIDLGTGDDAISPNVFISRELMSLLIRLNGGNLVADLQKHPPQQAETRFNADEYVTASFEPVPEFSSMPVGAAGIIYREGLGRIIVVALLSGLDDPETRTEWMTGMGIMSFVD